MARPVVVIGAGLGGLSAACRLAGKGHEVTVLEAGSAPGGRAGQLEMGGYRFDTGPTVLTMPHLVEDCFRAAGTEMADFLELLPVDPMYRACFADGTELRVRNGHEAMRAEIATVCGSREADAFDKFVEWLRRLYAPEMPSFIARNYDSPFDLVRPLRPAMELLRLGGFRRLSSVVASRFDDDRLRRLFTFQSMYAGLAPYEALALYGVITYMDTVNGVFVPRGGMHALPVAMAAAAEKAGAVLRYDARVERILLSEGTSGTVRGVRLESGEVISADRVVCNADLPVAYRTLLPGTAPPRTVSRGNYSPSCVVWHVGLRGELPAGAEHHNIHFGNAWNSAFRSVMKEGTLMADPSILVTAPTRTEPTAAPSGAHALYVLEPVPNLDGKLDWGRARALVRDRLGRLIDRLGYRGRIEVEAMDDPLDWEQRGMERGTPFSLSHRFLQTGPFRPDNRPSRAPGLVFVGSGTQPGVGIPMVLISGQLAAQRIEEMG